MRTMNVFCFRLRLAFGGCVVLACAAVMGGAEPLRLRIPRGLDEFVPIPPDNPLTEEKVQLGKRLFFDRALSRDGTVSCGTCHVPGRMFSNGELVGVGVAGRVGHRNVPTLFNRAYQKSFFWDGRETSLERQVLEPIQNPQEMDLTLAEFEARLSQETPGEQRRVGGRSLLAGDASVGIASKLAPTSEKSTGYRAEFQSVFGERPTAANAAKALAGYIRVLNYANSAFDRFQFGEAGALSESAQRGLKLFRGKGNCTSCHSGPLLADEEFHNTGVSWGKIPLDLGRFEVTGRDADRGRFKTPTLRDVAFTAPYMHDGSLPTLEDVLEFYNRGGTSNPYLDREIRPLNLNPEEKRDLVEFLEALNGNP